MSVRKCRGHLQATRDLRYSHSSLPIEHGAISVPPPLLKRFYLALVSYRLGMILVPFWGCLSSHGVMTLVLLLLGLINTNPAGPGEIVFYPHPSTRSCPDTENPIESSIPLDAQSLWRVVRFSTKVHMCYQCFYSTLASMLPKLN